MKRFYFLSVATLVAGIIGLLSLEATAAPKNTIKPIPAPKKGQPTAPPGSTNTTTATGGAGGSGAQGGAGGGAVAVGGNNSGTIINGNNNTINNITKVTNNNISFSPSFGGGGSGGGSSGGGIAIAGAGGDGFIPGTPGVALASGPSQTVITTDGSPAIAQGAPGKAAQSSSVSITVHSVWTVEMELDGQPIASDEVVFVANQRIHVITIRFREDDEIVTRHLPIEMIPGENHFTLRVDANPRLYCHAASPTW